MGFRWWDNQVSHCYAHARLPVTLPTRNLLLPIPDT
ncbi:hypothetical protein MPL1032_100250 [Mesorhizobium plurifarium]|uniref:Uncharacterized protein n=1 Tax=Mesorhizobium plurifarium TaxID=69974 RepID=A0A0K2VNQ0_MESPL|nr:hypothetical protein MPL1032_100250 [Mesorhizobium plurifarium]